MSIFKTQWVIIKVKKIADKNNIYTIFSNDYWKILCTKKISNKEKTLDIGYIIHCEIEVKQWVNIHKIKNIKITWEFRSIWENFSIINNFLILLSIIEKKVPENLENKEIFHSLESIIFYHHPHLLNSKDGRKITPIKIILIQLKIISLLWLLNIHDKNPTIKKILSFIHTNKAENILRLSGISEELGRELEELVRM